MGDQPATTRGEEALDHWIATFRGPLIGLLASWGTDWRAAEELAQDTFAEAWMSRERLVGSPFDLEVVGAWLRGIAFNLHRAAQRKTERARAVDLEDCEPATSEAERGPRRVALAECFGRLSGAHQTVLRMHYLEETSAKEVAALLGLTPKAVESRLYQARKALRKELDVTQAKSTTEVRA